MIDFLGLGAVGFIGIGLLAAVVNVFRNRTTISGSGDVVPADVQGLADAAGYDVGTYALARVSASEAGGQKRIAKQGVLSVVVNESARSGRSLLDVVLGSGSTFGAQGTGGRGFVSSAHDPGSIDFDVAGGIADGSTADPTGGALHFDSPGAYKDKLDADGNVVATAQQRIDAFAAARSAEGMELVLLDGVPESTFRFWRPA